MVFSHLPPFLSRLFAALAAWLDRRTAARLPRLLAGMLFARGRRTVTSWFRAAGITTEFRPAYHVVYAVGRRAPLVAVTAWSRVELGDHTRAQVIAGAVLGAAAAVASYALIR